MRDWYRVFTENKKLLAFGFLFSFFSCFGQTFFVSLFVPHWVESLQITKTAIGSIYAVVTIAAAFLISFFGKYIDTVSLKKYSLIVFIGLILSVVLLSQVNGVIMLTAGLFLIRWLGQGLMTHASSTGIAKYIIKNRGKALSFSALGHPAGNFLLPFIMLPLIALTGWSNSLLVVSGFALIVMLPVIAKLDSVTLPELQDGNNPVKEDTAAQKINHLKTSNFWIISVNIFALPFILTAVFLYQYSIGEARGYSPSWIAFSFSFFAIFSAIGLLISGNLTDRYSGMFLFPLYLIPAVVGVLLLSVSDNRYLFPVFYALSGIASGLGSVIKTAAQTEIYGTSNLGKVRGYFGTIMVISTALGPPIFAFFIERSVSFNTLMLFSGLLISLTIAVSFKMWSAEHLSRLKAFLLIPFGKSKTGTK